MQQPLHSLSQLAKAPGGGHQRAKPQHVGAHAGVAQEFQFFQIRQQRREIAVADVEARHRAVQGIARRVRTMDKRTLERRLIEGGMTAAVVVDMTIGFCELRPSDIGGTHAAFRPAEPVGSVAIGAAHHRPGQLLLGDAEPCVEDIAEGTFAVLVDGATGLLLRRERRRARRRRKHGQDGDKQDSDAMTRCTRRPGSRKAISPIPGRRTARNAHEAGGQARSRYQKPGGTGDRAHTGHS